MDNESNKNNKIKTFIGIGAFAVLIAIAVFAYDFLQTGENAPHETPQNPAPDFTILDAENNEVRLSDFFGKPIVLNFWTTWCPACVAELPVFENMYHEMGDEVHFLKVNLLDGTRETREDVDSFMAERNLTFSVYFDTTGEASDAYGVRGIPMTFFIDAEGQLVAGIQGPADEGALREGIEMAGR